jgi:hypothetical protein
MFKPNWLILGALVALSGACEGTPGDGEEVLEPSSTTSDVDTSNVGSGGAARTPASNPDAQVSTRITVRVYKDGHAEVLRAIEQPGLATLVPVMIGDHVYEVRSHGQTLAIESFVGGFEKRSLVNADDPNFKLEDEHTGLEEESMIVQVKVPGRSLADNDFEVVLHRLAAPLPHDHAKLDAETLSQLSRAGVLRQIASLSASAIRPHLASGLRAPANIYQMTR